MRASVVISTFNHADLLDRTLESIYRQNEGYEFEVVVVNDGCSDHTEHVLARYPVRPFRIERPPVHGNPARGRNLAIFHAQSDVLVMQSDDVMHISAQPIRRFVELIDRAPRSVVFASVDNVDATGRNLGRYVHPRTNKRKFFFLGAIRRSDLITIGGNDEEFTLPGWEDTWLKRCMEFGLQANFHWTYDILGHHQDHSRPVERYGKYFTARDPMKRLYKRKVEAAEQGIIPWRAAQSLLYTIDTSHA